MRQAYAQYQAVALIFGRYYPVVPFHNRLCYGKTYARAFLARLLRFIKTNEYVFQIVLIRSSAVVGNFNY